MVRFGFHALFDNFEIITGGVRRLRPGFVETECRGDQGSAHFDFFP